MEKVHGQPVMRTRLQNLRDRPTLKDSPAHGVIDELVGTPNSKQKTEKTSIVEVQFGGLDQPFLETAVKRGQPEHNVAGFENREPSPGSVVGDTTVCTQLGKVEQLDGLGLFVN